MSLAHTYVAALLVDHCCSPQASESDLRALEQWAAERDLAPVATRAAGYGGDAAAGGRELVYDGYDEANTVPNSHEQ